MVGNMIWTKKKKKTNTRAHRNTRVPKIRMIDYIIVSRSDLQDLQDFPVSDPWEVLILGLTTVL